MIRRRESTIKSRILEEEDDEDNSQGSTISYRSFYDILYWCPPVEFIVDLLYQYWTLPRKNFHSIFFTNVFKSKTPSAIFQPSNRPSRRTYSYHAFLFRSESFVFDMVSFHTCQIDSVNPLYWAPICVENYTIFSAALTYLMLRTMDCETFKNACWAKVQPFQVQTPKKSALGAALKSVQKAKT